MDDDSDSLILDVKFFAKDHLGNVRVAYTPFFAIEKNKGTETCELKYYVNSVMDYYPNGKHLRSYFAEEPERFQTTENERDIESGLDYRGARYYDSEYGRFVSVDPKQGAFPKESPYCYSLNNPIYYSDPNGECPWCPGAVGAIVGGGLTALTLGYQGADFTTWQTWAKIGTGAGIGALSAYVPSTWPIFGQVVVSGALGVTNTVIQNEIDEKQQPPLML